MPFRFKMTFLQNRNAIFCALKAYMNKVVIS